MHKNVLNIVQILTLTFLFQGLSTMAFGQNLGTYNVSRTNFNWYQYASVMWYNGGQTPTWNCNSNDDNISQPNLIGFDFPYNGMTCKSFYISSNGFIVLDTISTSTNLANNPYPRYATNPNPGCGAASTNNYAYNDSCSAMYQSGANNYSAMTIAPFYDDLITYYNGSYSINYWIKYKVSGTAPNRFLTVEWYAMQLKGYNYNIWNWNYNWSFLYFQVRLYETSGTIEFWHAFDWVYPYNANLSSNYKFVMGLSSNGYTSTLPNANYVFTDSVANSASFSGRLNYLTYPNTWYTKYTFTRPGADIGVNSIYPPNPDTCGYSSSQIIVDTIVNYGSATLTFDASHPLKVYTKITGAINVLDSGTYTGTLAPNAVAYVQMANPVNMTTGGTYTLKSYVNDSIFTTTTAYADQNVSNDTAVAIFNVGTVTAIAARTTICNGDTTQLNAISTTFGHVAKIAYSPPTLTSPTIPAPWTSNTIPDDGASSTINLPFTFYYFGSPKTSFQICTNGFIEFDLAYTTQNGLSLPTSVLPTDVIALAWADLKPNYGGVIQYQTLGTAPNREFVLQYNGVYDTTSSNLLSAYVILHESSNIIEFQNGNIPLKNYTQGIEDSTGTYAYGLSSRNGNSWSASNDAYLLVSQPNYSWSPTTGLSNPYIADPIASPTVTTTYTVTLNGGNNGYPDSTGVCPKTSSVTINITPGLGAISPISGYTNICAYTNVTYAVPPVTNATSYIWDYSNLNGATQNYQLTDTLSLTLGGYSGWLRVRGYNSSCGTYTTWDSLYINVIPSYYGPGQWCGGVSNDWFNIYNWCVSIPTSNIDANIDGILAPLHFPVINGSGAICRNLILYGDYDSLTINGTYNLDVYGSWYNGFSNYSTTFTANSSTVNFVGSATNWEVINGLVPNTFHNIVVNKGTDTSYVLENVQGDTLAMTGNLSLINGLFRVTETGSAVRFASAPTIPSTAGLELNGGTITPGNYSITNNGVFRMTVNSSNVTLGNTAGNSLTTTGSSSLMEVYGGNLSIASQLIVANGSSFYFDDSNSNSQPNSITLNALGTASNTSAVFDINSSSRMSLGSGKMILHKANTGTGEDVKIISGVSKTITGGTFQFGDATTPANQTFGVMDSTVAFNNVSINTTNNPIVRMDSRIALNSSGILALSSGIWKLNSDTLTINNTSNSAISRTTGNILAESSNNKGAINWHIPIDNQPHVFPFGTKYGGYIPFSFSGTGGTSAWVKVATYSPQTDTASHRPLPSSPTNVTHIRNIAGLDDSLNMVNRFWQIDVTGGSPVATVKFYYAGNEIPANNTAGLRAQRWNNSNTGWVQPTIIGTQTADGTNFWVQVTGVSTFSPWTLAKASSPLPIELLSFTAINEQNRFVRTEWTTASEVNNDYFEVERSQDGKNFDIIGRVPGNGNTNSIHNYQFDDNSPFSGLSYYKLKQTDFDGKNTTSDLVSVEFNYSNSGTIIPNPNDGNFTLAYHLSTAKALLQVKDITGRLVYSQDINGNDTKETVNISFLSAGIYFWELLTNNDLGSKGKITIVK